MLDPKTTQLIKELFEGKNCAICGKTANRIHHSVFYCLEHVVHQKTPIKKKENFIFIGRCKFILLGHIKL